MRGDGRRFIANVDCPNFVTKEDLWQYFMMTRGGPEWEKITVSYHGNLNQLLHMCTLF